MNFYIYKISNLVTNRYYIGQRGCECQPEDDIGYWGSSYYLDLERAIDPENWVKEILATFRHRGYARGEERRLVDPKDPLCINKARGGFGTKNDIYFDDEVKRRMSIAISNARKGVPMSDVNKAALSKAKKGVSTGLASDATKAKMSQSKRGVPKSDAHKAAMSKARRGVPLGPAPTITCPHCGKTGGSNAMKRYHFNNCKALSDSNK